MSILKFETRGADIAPYDKTYAGDIDNHRITAEIEHNGVRFYISVHSIATWRKTHQVTSAPLKHPIRTSDNNGLSIEISAFYTEVLQGSTGGYFMHDTMKPLHRSEYNDHLRTYHTKALILKLVNRELKTNFTEIILE